MDLPDTILLKIMIRTSGFARAMCTEIRPLAGFARRAENLRMQGREYAYILNAMAEYDASTVEETLRKMEEVRGPNHWDVKVACAWLRNALGYTREQFSAIRRETLQATASRLNDLLN